MSRAASVGVLDTSEPPRDCPLCPRLTAFRQAARESEPTWFNAPVPTFGPRDARLLIVGLAPGLKGANRTGRPFTGDYAGDLLYATLLAHGFARGTYDQRADDGLELRDCAVTNAVRCVPPQNKPLPLEIGNCRPFLSGVLAERTHVRAIVALGRVAHESVARALGLRLAATPFRHGARHSACADGRPVAIFDSYHCSRYNTNTGVLTPDMFDALFAQVRVYLEGV